MSLWSSSSQKVNIDDTSQMVNTFLESTNRRVSAMASSNQEIHTGDYTIKGNRNKIRFDQVANISGAQYVDSLNASQLDIKSAMISQLEATMQNDKGAGGGIAGGVTPFGGGGSVSGLLTSASSKQNINKRMDLVTAVSNVLSEVSENKMLNTQEIDKGSVFIDGDENEVDYSQGAALTQLSNIVSKDKRVTTAIAALESKTTSKATMTNSSSKMMMIVGVIIVMLLLGKTAMGGGSSQQQTPEVKCTAAEGQQRHACIQREASSQRNTKVFKGIMFAFALVFGIMLIWFIWTKLTGFLRGLF